MGDETAMAKSWLTCATTGRRFQVEEDEQAVLEMVARSHPLIDKPLPPPALAPMEFFRTITSWGNLLNIFRARSAVSGAVQLSRYDPSLGIKVCTPDEFWSDRIDNTEFGRPYDFSRPFFDQFSDLIHDVYFMPLNASNCEGSDYVNGANGAKNSFLCFGIFNSEDCIYSYMVRDSSDCVDCIEITGSQFCYDCHTMENCYGCRHCRICTDSADCLFCEDCIGCKNCIFCYGLRRAEFCIANQPVTRAEYDSFVSELKLDSRAGVEAAEKRFAEELRSAGYRTNTLLKAEDSSGKFLSNVKNVKHSYYVHDARDCGYILLSNNCSNFWRGFAEKGELGYQAGVYAGAYCTYNSYMIVGGSYNLYSLILYNSCHHCFGSIGLKKNSYCILNKQYTEREYFELVPRIIEHMRSTGEWGKYLPPRLAPYYYEHAFCNDWLEPIEVAEATRRGYRTGYQPEAASTGGEPASSIPDSILECKPEIIDRTFICPDSGKPFKFQKKELQFYQRHQIPLPVRHWSERIKRRIAAVYLIPDCEDAI